jgi:hypothetical protein
MKFNVWIACSLLIPAGNAMAVPSCQILDYGIMDGERRIAEVGKRTQTVPARLGVRFGIVHEIRDVPDDGQLEAQIHHPPMNKPGASKVSVSGGKIDSRSRGTAYSLDQPFEVLPGQWRFEVHYKGSVLCEKSFNLLAQSAQSERYDNPVDRRTYVAPGGWNKYSPQESTAAQSQGKVRTQHIRLLSAQSDFDANVDLNAMTSMIKRVEKEAGEAFAKATKGAVLVQFNCGPQRQEVKLASEGNIDRALMQIFYDRLVKLDRLPVRQREVSFQIQFAIAD